MDGTTPALQRFLDNKKWWIKEDDKAFFLHVIHQDKEYISKPLPKLHTHLFRSDNDMKMTIVETVVGSIEVQIMRDDNERKMNAVRDLKDNRRKSFSPPYWKKKKWQKEY